ncbi:hypothetical protein D5R93_12505 [Actinomyces lilanjuaniae]|uniref:DUF805 domain-containing protein n=1 Tax=Actinomyces lilanjuaniae TaxID=2321394 RepID=A0ABM6Z616_9ACTO|nr:hypothetical protein [Actinomyces lilanjuaniae]AYD90616.1 hypothetical protein D5R93_12505 [Actinomyces lilanjuaniae]
MDSHRRPASTDRTGRLMRLLGGRAWLAAHLVTSTRDCAQAATRTASRALRTLASAMFRLTRGADRSLAPDWGWWALACGVIVTIAAGIRVRTGSPLTEIVLYGIPPALGCAWMMPACLRPYDDARRHLRENIAAPWLLVVILVPSNADDQVRQIVASSPVRTTLAALLAVYTWLGVCQAILSVHHDYRERRLTQTPTTRKTTRTS